MPDTILNEEQLKSQSTLTPDQEEAIQKQAMEELELEGMSEEEQAEYKKKKEEGEEGSGEEEETGKTDEELLEADDESLSEEEKTKKQELVSAKAAEEEKRILEAKDEDLSEEDKTRKADILKAREAKASEAREQEIKDYAAENKISVDEAKQDLESIGKIAEKYESDPKKLAKANLHLQRMANKAVEEVKALKENPPTPPVQNTVEGWIEAINEGKMSKDGKPLTKDQVVDAYRAKHPKITEDEDDDTVVKMAAKDIIGHIEKARTAAKSEATKKANEVRASIVDNLSEEDKKFAAEIKEVVDASDDNYLLHEKFDEKEVINHVKGRHYDEDVKAAEDRGFKKGQEQAKILGLKKTPSGDGKPKKGSTKTKITDAEKERAFEMFDGQEMTDEAKIAAYLEVKKHEESLDSK